MYISKCLYILHVEFMLLSWNCFTYIQPQAHASKLESDFRALYPEHSEPLLLGFAIKETQLVVRMISCVHSTTILLVETICQK